MRGSSSPEAPVWWELPLDWPVECVPCELEVVEPRQLTALEWAVLQVLSSFGDAPPSLEETAQELGLAEPKFLRDILRTLISQQALMPRPGVDTPQQLNEVLFTERGRELFRKGQVDGKPAHPTQQLYFDVLTEEALPPVTHSVSPQRAIIDASTLPQPRQEVGLDRVRDIVRQFKLSIGGADAHIRTVRVLSSSELSALHAGHRWITHSLALVPTPEGQLALHTPSLSARQRDWLLEQQLSQWVDPSRAVTATWEEPPAFQRSHQPWAAWRGTVERLVPPSSVLSEAKRLISTARREVLLHAAWASAPELEDVLMTAASRGVALYVPGATATRITAWSTAVQRPPGFILELACPGAVPGALVVDRSEALLLDEVSAEVEGLGRYTFEVVGWTRQRATALCPGLLEAILAALLLTEVAPPPPLDVLQASPPDASVRRLLNEPRLQMELARFALSPTPADWARLEAWIATQCVGVDRVAALHQVSDMASRLAPNVPSAPWKEAWSTAWRALSSAILAEAPSVISDEVLRALFRLTPPGVGLPETLDPLVERWVTPVPATQNPDALRLLSRLRLLADERWQAGAALQCPRFRAAFERCLEASAPAPDGQSLASLCQLVASAAPKERARAWGEAVADLWPRPSLTQGFEAWQRRHAPLRDLLGPSLPPRLLGAWKALIEASPARKAEQMVEQLRCIREFLTAPEALAQMVAVPGPEWLTEKVDRLLQLREACRTVWEQNAPKEEVWSRYLQQLLSVPSKGYAAELHGPLLSELTRQCRGWSAAESALRTWAQQLASTLPAPTRADGIPGWLESLRGLAGALGSEGVQSIAMEGVRRHQGALREARHRQAPLWAELTEAWRELGLELAPLEALLNPPRAAESKGSGKKRKQGGKTR